LSELAGNQISKRFILVLGYKSGISKDEISKTHLENKPPKNEKIETMFTL
jgi:hypothetical protein